MIYLKIKNTVIKTNPLNFTFDFDMQRYGFYIRYYLPQETNLWGRYPDSRNPKEYWQYFKINRDISSMEDLEKFTDECVRQLTTKKGIFSWFK